MNKEKFLRVLKIILKVILIITFVTSAIIIGYNLYIFIFGYDVYTWILPTYVRTDYGFDAIGADLANIVIYLPMLALNTIFQITYLIVSKIRKKKQN